MSAVRRFLTSTEGATAVEYAMMIALIATAVYVAVGYLGNATRDRIFDTATKIGT